MPARSGNGESTGKRLIIAEEKIARLLGVIATREMPRTQQCATLRAVGFDNASIGDMLGITANQAADYIYKASKQAAAREKQEGGENKSATARKARKTSKRKPK